MPRQRRDPWMSIPIPAGHHAICRLCGGTGVREQARAHAKRRVDGVMQLGTAYIDERCKPCEATGWIPPKHAPDVDGQEQEPEGPA